MLFTSILLCICWLLVALLKGVLSGFFLHLALALLFVGGSIVLYYWQERPKPFCFSLRNFPAVRTFLGLSSPSSKVGLLLVAIYIVVTFIAAVWKTGGFDYPIAAFSGILTTRFVLGFAFAPFYEELFFRGALCSVLFALYSDSNKRSTFWPIYLSALIFWLFHAPLSPELWIRAWQHGGIPFGPGPFLLGLACAWLRYRDGSIWSASALHVAANAFGPLWGLVLTNEKWLGLFYG